MKEFLNALKCVLVSQLICWSIFSISNIDNSFEIGMLLLIILLYIYFDYSNKFINKNNLNSKKFNIFLLILWTVSSIIFSIILFPLADKYIHICTGDSWDCFLNGIQFFIYAFFMICLAILILLIKLIIKIYNHFKKEK